MSRVIPIITMIILVFMIGVLWFIPTLLMKKTLEPTDMTIVLHDNNGIEHTFSGLIQYTPPGLSNPDYTITTFDPHGDLVESKTFSNPVSVEIVSGIEERNQQKSDGLGKVLGLLAVILFGEAVIMAFMRSYRRSFR